MNPPLTALLPEEGLVLGAAASIASTPSSRKGQGLSTGDNTATVRKFADWLGEASPETSTTPQQPANLGATHQQNLLALLAQDEQRLQAQRLRQQNNTAATEANQPTPTADDTAEATSQAEPTESSKATSNTKPPVADSVKEATLPNTDAAAWLAAMHNRPLHQAEALPGFSLQQALSSNALALAEGVGGGSSLAGQKLLSAQLERWLNSSLNTGAPIRIHVDKTMSLVLRLKQGQVHADFLQQQGEANAAAKLGQLQTQLDELKQRLANQRLPVGQSTAKGHSGGGQHPPSQQQQHPSNQT